MRAVAPPGPDIVPYTRGGATGSTNSGTGSGSTIVSLPDPTGVYRVTGAARVAEKMLPPMIAFASPALDLATAGGATRGAADEATRLSSAFAAGNGGWTNQSATAAAASKAVAMSSTVLSLAVFTSCYSFNHRGRAQSDRDLNQSASERRVGYESERSYLDYGSAVLKQ